MFRFRKNIILRIRFREREIKLKIRLTEAVHNVNSGEINEKSYSGLKIARLFSLYFYYVRSILDMMVILHYDVFDLTEIIK